MNRLARFVSTRPWVVLLVIALVSAPAAIFAFRVRIDSSADSLIPKDSPEARFYEETRALFGNDGVDVVVLVADDIYRPETIAKLARLDRALAAVEGVERVQSLASIEVVTPAPDGVAYGRAMPAVPTTEAETLRLRTLVREDPILRGTFVSDDGRAAMLVVDYRRMPIPELVASGIVERVEQVLERERGPEELHLIGVPSTYVTSSRVMLHDLGVFVPVTSLIIIGVLLLSFRSLRGVFVPLSTIGIGLLWTIGLMGFFEAPIDFLGMMLPSLLLAVGIAYATHVVAASYEETEAGGSASEIVARVIGHLGPPVFVTAFTTFLGFGGLVVYRIPAIRSFGLFAAFGIAALFLLSVTFTAALLAILPPRRASAVGDRDWPWLRARLDSIVRFDLRHRRGLLVGALLVTAVFGAGIPRIESDSNYTNYFPAGSPLRVAAQAVDRHLGGSVNFLVVVDGGEPNALTRADTLRRLEELEDFIAHLPGVGAVSSIVDVIHVMHRALRPPDAPAASLPSSDDAAQQYLLLVPPEATESFLASDASRGVLRVRTSIRGSRELGGTLRRIEEFGRTAMPRGFHVQVTGAVPVINASADALTTGQVQSVVLSMSVLFVVLAAFFVSIRLGLVAMLPNLIPIVVYFGVLGWAGIPLSISTALIASIVLGLGVDEAIHLLSEFNVKVREHGDQERAIREAMESVGPPVVFASTSLSLGFLAQALSGYVPIQQFAVLSAMNVFTSLLADLLLLPAFVASVRFVSLWDLLRLKLGSAPERTVPLFHGLRSSEARVALLLGQLRTVAREDRIVTQGDPGDSMFVLVSGRAEVRVRNGNGCVTLRTVRQGDVIGEMGLLRQEARSADVVAIEPCEVLRVDQTFFDALLRRSPRIAGKVLINLSRVLSDRVQSLTDSLVASNDRARGAA